MRGRSGCPRRGRARGGSAATRPHARALELLPRHLVLTAPVVAAELGIPLKSASAALHDLVAAGVLVEHGTVQPDRTGSAAPPLHESRAARPRGSNPLR